MVAWLWPDSGILDLDCYSVVVRPARAVIAERDRLTRRMLDARRRDHRGERGAAQDEATARRALNALEDRNAVVWDSKTGKVIPLACALGRCGYHRHEGRAA